MNSLEHGIYVGVLFPILFVSSSKARTESYISLLFSMPLSPNTGGRMTRSQAVWVQTLVLLLANCDLDQATSVFWTSVFLVSVGINNNPSTPRFFR